jgi:hypothetical protein
MEEIMSEQTITSTTPLSDLARNSAANGNWWEEEALGQRNVMQLPTHVLRILDNAGIRTVEQLKAAGPIKLRELEGIGKLAFDQIVQLLRALDRNGGEH